jgi:hypothetical protein
MSERIPVVYNDNAGQLQEISLSDAASVGLMSARAYSSLNFITNEAIVLASTSFNYFSVGPVVLGAGGTVTVGAGVSYAVL